ncbi:MAG: cell division topological specificity factor MinE [Lachnospiraceae bacterium]|nr:cell division topological specificity factor MinE [Robinsoniella sp.]MDY3765391.1 cell division topological specificity factor MinE [Lachnospiraceae bacterium]
MMWRTHREEKSRGIAKERIQSTLLSDRTDCTPEMLEQIDREIFQVVRRYFDIKPEELHVRLEIVKNQK